MPRREERDPAYEYMVCKIIGGDAPGAAFSQRCGAMKINGKVVGEDIKKKTMADYKYQKVNVEVAVQNRQVTVRIIPTTSQSIIRELKETRVPKKRSGEKIPRHHNYPLSLESLFKIVDETFEIRSRSKNKKGALKEVLGSAKSVGCTIEGKCPKEVNGICNEGREKFANYFAVPLETIPEWLD